jgi:hypothetical protein
MDKKDKTEDQTTPAVKAAESLSILWPKVREFLIRSVLIRWIPRVAGGFWGWIATFAIDWILQPVYEFTVRKLIVWIRKKKNNEQGRKLEQSKTEDEFDHSSDNLP